MLRAWEKVGIVQPERTDSTYRLYSEQDVAVLRRAVYLRKYRGLNAAAVLHHLRSEGHLAPRTNGQQRSDPMGPMLRKLRKKRGEPLSVAAAAAGISVGFLSNLERGQTSASAGTLHRLAEHYGLQMMELFDRAERSLPLVRATARKTLQGGPGVSIELLAWGPIVMGPQLFHIAPGAGCGRRHAHEGQEFLFVMKGQFTISLDDEEYRLKSGDSFYFEGARSHHSINPGKTETVIRGSTHRQLFNDASGSAVNSALLRVNEVLNDLAFAHDVF
jgi:uncharacterized cupin superfamily protein/DNA-binding transcriptional MerR regulator